MAAQLGVEIDGPPSLFPPAEPAAVSRICTASRHLHRHYRMRRKRRAARRRPPSGGPQFNVKTLARPTGRRKIRTMSEALLGVLIGAFVGFAGVAVQVWRDAKQRERERLM